MFGPGPGYSREGLSTRQQGGFSVVVDKPYDVDSEVEGLQSQVGRLKDISRLLGEEVKENRSIAEGLDATLEDVTARLRRGMRRLNRAYARSKNNHWTYLVLFILAAFLFVYCWSSVARIVRWLK